MRRRSAALIMALAALGGLGACRGGSADRGATASAAALSGLTTPFTVPAGAQIRVRLTSALSSETARVGDPWSGTLAAALAIGEREIVPAGTVVHGRVTGAHPAGPGTRAMLDLAIRDVPVAGASQVLAAGTEAILAELPPAPVSAQAASTAQTKSMAGGTTHQVMPARRGAEVMLDPGTEMVFTVEERAVVR